MHLPSAASLITLQILISPRNGSTEALVIASLKSPRGPKVQKEKFQAERHTVAVLTGMPFPLPSAQTSLPPDLSWLFAQVPHQHQCGAQLAHHFYHLKEGFQVYRGQVTLHRYISGLCCFQHHCHCCHHQHYSFHNLQDQGQLHWLPSWTLMIVIPIAS